MKPNDIFSRAARLCGIGEEFLSENELTDVHARALDAINTVLFDLEGREPIESIGSQETVAEKTAEAAVYGGAMCLSLAFGDTNKSALFSDIYNQKRSAVKSNIASVVDALPRTGAV